MREYDALRMERLMAQLPNPWWLWLRLVRRFCPCWLSR